MVPGGSDAGGFLTFLPPRVLTLHQNGVCLSYEHATRTFQSLLLQTLPLGGVLRLLLTSSFSAGGLRNAATQPVIDKLGSVKTLPAWNLTLTLWEYHKHIHGKGQRRAVRADSLRLHTHLQPQLGTDGAGRCSTRAPRKHSMCVAEEP